MSPRALPTLACLALAACGTAPQDALQSEATQREELRDFLPQRQGLNVIIVSFDALRADALGTYGNPLDLSPHIDAFARRSLVFEQAYSAAQATPTSFAAAFTGLYPFRSFLKWSLIETQTLGEVFQSSGYTTAGFFNNPQLVAERNFHQGFQAFHVEHLADEDFLKIPEKWLRDHHNERILVWIHFVSPHPPYDYRKMAAKLYSADYQGRFKWTSGLLRDVFQVEDPREVARLKELYAGEVLYADTLFAQFQALLEELGLMEKSIIALTSDHGEEFGEHGSVAHRQLYEEVIRVPMIVYHPDVRRGHRTQTPYLNVDLLPTLAGIVGVEAPAALDGIDLLGEYPEPHTLLSTAMTGQHWRSISVRSGDHKLILTCPPRERKEELFDLNADPGETNNLVMEAPDIARELRSLMMTQTRGDPCEVIDRAARGATLVEGLDEGRVEQLRSLGYVQ